MVFSQGGHTKHHIIQTGEEWCSRKWGHTKHSIIQTGDEWCSRKGVILNIKHHIIQTGDEWCSRKGVILNTALFKQEMNGVLARGSY